MTTKTLFQDDAYLKSCAATVTAVVDQGLVLDQTVFYAQGGGQPGDTGTLTLDDGTTLAVTNTVKGEGGAILHLIEDGAALPVEGTPLTATIDWDRRYSHMRIHTCLHLLSAALPYPVTGGSIGDGKGRLDFDLPELTLTKEEITAELNILVQADSPVTFQWITDEELDAQPDLVKTMSVQPPRGSGQVRLINIGDTKVDLQPCGGTHVKSTGEIGPVVVQKIQKKGRQNRRVSIAFAE